MKTGKKVGNAPKRIVVEFVTVTELKTMNTSNSNLNKYFTLQTNNGAIINSKERFFQAVNHSFPLNPPGASDNWAALEDSLFGGLLGLV